MEERFIKSSVIDLHSIQDLEIPENLTYDNEKGQQNTTSDGAQRIFDQHVFYMKKLYQPSNSYEISFQKTFMEEHAKAYQKNYQNYMEALSQFQQNIQCQLKNLDYEDIKIKSAKPFGEIMLAHEQKWKTQDIIHFRQSLIKYEKLSEYLNFVCDSTWESIAFQLMEIALKILQGNCEIIDYAQSPIKLTKRGCQIAKHMMKIGGFGDQQDLSGYKLKERYFQLLKVYCSTVLLVSAQYFENPFIFDRPQTTRKRSIGFDSSSQDQQSFEITPRKLRKFSF